MYSSFQKFWNHLHDITVILKCQDEFTEKLLCLVDISEFVLYNQDEVILLKYEIGARIRKYREISGISQKELAERIHVSSSRVSNWEQGINRPDAGYLAAICSELKVSPSLLLDVRLEPDDLSEQERRVIMAYRAKTDLQKAVNILLGVDE